MELFIIVCFGIAAICIAAIITNIKKHGSFSKWNEYHKSQQGEGVPSKKPNITVGWKVHKSQELTESEEFMRLNNRGTFPLEAKHFETCGLIQAAYGRGEYDECEHLCLEDINFYPNYIAEMKVKEEMRITMARSEIDAVKSGKKVVSEGYLGLLQRSRERTHIPNRFTSFETLVKLYEKQGRFSEAITICDKAIKYGISDGTKGGFTERKRRLENVQSALFSDDSFDFIKDGFAFEEFVCGLLIKNGYKAEVTTKSGDFGVDVIAEKGGIRYAVQCKHSSSPVGLKAVQEVFTATTHFKCNVGVVAATNTFTKSAEELAASTNVLLWDKSKILELAQEK